MTDEERVTALKALLVRRRYRRHIRRSTAVPHVPVLTRKSKHRAAAKVARIGP
jgi:hypothetical protein